MIRVHETYSTGFITKIVFYDATDTPVKVGSGTDSTSCPGWFEAEINPAFTTQKVRIFVDTNVPGWNEIDAVGLVAEESADWTLLYDSNYSSTSSLKIGVTVANGTHRLDELSTAKGATGPNPRFEFLEAGVHTVTLTVTDHALQTGTETTTVEIADGAPPTADAGGPYTVEVGTPITFNGTGSTDDNAVEAYEWTFGDTTGPPADLPYRGKGATPRHFYREVGVYDLEFKVTDNTLKTDIDTTTVNVIEGEPPVADAGGPYIGGAGGPAVLFDGGGSSDDYGVVDYHWDFDAEVDSDGDGDPTNDVDGTGRRVLHTYAVPTGTFLKGDFSGTEIDSGAWRTGSANQDDLITITGAGSWGPAHLFSNDS